MAKQKPPPTLKPSEGIRKTGKVEKPKPTPQPSVGIKESRKKK